MALKVFKPTTPANRYKKHPDFDDNVLLISGAIPGAKGGYVVIRPAVKKSKPAEKQ